MTGRGPRRWRRLGAALAATALLVLFLAVVPIERYRPACASFHEDLQEGPLRQQYIELLTEAMREDGVTYARIGDTIYTPVFDILQWDQIFSGRREFFDNNEWKIASSIGRGVTLNGRYFPPPEPVLALIRETESRYGPFPRRLPNGQILLGPDERFRNCELMRAAIIRVEDMASAAAPR